MKHAENTDKKEERLEEVREEKESNEASCKEPQGDALHECLAEVSLWKERYMRAHADLDNARKRMERDVVQRSQEGQKKILKDLLTIADDFDRALSAHDADDDEKKEWLAGFELIHSSLYKVLKSYGVVPMPQERYKEFDPTYHEAVLHIPSEAYSSGAIVEVVQKGFLMNDTVLRPAKVCVAQ